jgi:hypothetical protein
MIHSFMCWIFRMSCTDDVWVQPNQAGSDKFQKEQATPFIHIHLHASRYAFDEQM